MVIEPQDKAAPLVSVITPSYNSADYLEETIRSVLDQDYAPLEHIVIDGGSTDGSLAILKRYDELIKWISEPDSGQSEALNKGFRRARGDVIGWLNADDLYLPGAVSRAVAYLDEHPEIAAVYSDAEIVDGSGRFLNQWQGREFSLEALTLGHCFICQPTIFLRRAALASVGWLDERLHFTMDYDLWLRLGLRFKLGYLPQTAACFRLHSTSKTSKRMIHFHAERLNALGKLFRDPLTPPEVVAIENEAYARAHLLAACHHLHLDEITSGQRELCAAAKLAPSIVTDPDVFLPWVIGSLPANINPVPLVRKIFAHLPDTLKHLSHYQGRAESWAHIAWAFAAHRRHDYRNVRHLLWKALRRDPSWLRNRGVLSIGLEAYLGPCIARTVRSLVKISPTKVSA